MINLNDTLYFHNMRGDPAAPTDYWKSVRDECGPGGKFYCDIAKRFMQSRFVSRDGSEWSLPWKQEMIPDFVMPKYDPSFNKTFEQVTDDRALEMKKLIHQGQKLAVMYSGGMDSTLVLVALLRNLTEEELKSVVICASIHSIIEYPTFWEKHIQGKFKIIESLNNWYDDIIGMGYRPITADEGDCIFGTSIGLQMYHNWDGYLRDLSPDVKQRLSMLRYQISNQEVHYSTYKDILIRHLAYDRSSPEGLEFGRILYEKYVHNINTSEVPVHSLHDFFWWLIFNVKYLNCSVRGAIYYNTRIPVRECIDSIENWFNGKDYQLWSMVNNNNGEKIRKTLATYKYAERQYIYDFTKDEWYFNFKTKLESLGNLLIKGKRHPGNLNLGVSKNYDWLSVEDADVREYFRHHLVNYKIDWTDT